MQINGIKISEGVTSGRVAFYNRGKDLDYGNDQIVIVTTENLNAEDTNNFEWEKIAGVIITQGGPNSHVAIVARTYQKPTIQLTDISSIRKGDWVSIDAYSQKKGNVYINPDEKEEQQIEQAKKMYDIIQENLNKYREMKGSKTLDGKKIIVAANIGSSQESDLVKKEGAEGIGVVRTELMYEQKTSGLPSEDELFQEYSSISSSQAYNKENRVIIRTLDAGADKPVQSLINAGILIPNESNPALGSRGVRPCIEKPDILKTQIKSILRANAKEGNLKIMFPMITEVSEIEECKHIVQQAINELQKEGKTFKECVIGIMVETPAIALQTNKLNKYCDFISVGSNDLTQYGTAADRTNSSVMDIASTFNPGMIEMLKQIVRGAKKTEKKIDVGICGEIGGDVRFTPILIAMGVDELSMIPSSIPKIRRLISHLTTRECEDLLSEIITLDTTKEVEERLTDWYQNKDLEICQQEKSEIEKGEVNQTKRTAEESIMEVR